MQGILHQGTLNEAQLRIKPGPAASLCGGLFLVSPRCGEVLHPDWTASGFRMTGFFKKSGAGVSRNHAQQGYYIRRFTTLTKAHVILSKHLRTDVSKCAPKDLLVPRLHYEREWPRTEGSPFSEAALRT